MPVVVYSSDPNTYRRVWAPFALWGLGLMAFGFVIMTWPALTARVFVTAFGTLSLLAGVTQLGSAALARKKLEGLTWLPVVAGLLGLAVGSVALLAPDFTTRLFALVIGLAALLWGVTDLAVGWSGRAYFSSWRLHVLRGVLTVAAGVFLTVRPLEAQIAVAWLVGGWAALIGAITVALALMARGATSPKS